MKKEMELVKFNLTPEMSLELINFNNLKRQLESLKKIYFLDKNEELFNKICNLEKELYESRKKFINDFRNNNHNEIIEYLKLRDQK